jgi:hypothetical protein
MSSLIMQVPLILWVPLLLAPKGAEPGNNPPVIRIYSEKSFYEEIRPRAIKYETLFHMKERHAKTYYQHILKFSQKNAVPQHAFACGARQI